MVSYCSEINVWRMYSILTSMFYMSTPFRYSSPPFLYFYQHLHRFISLKNPYKLHQHHQPKVIVVTWQPLRTMWWEWTARPSFITMLKLTKRDAPTHTHTPVYTHAHTHANVCTGECARMCVIHTYCICMFGQTTYKTYVCGQLDHTHTHTHSFGRERQIKETDREKERARFEDETGSWGSKTSVDTNRWSSCDRWNNQNGKNNIRVKEGRRWMDDDNVDICPLGKRVIMQWKSVYLIHTLTTDNT